MENKLKLVEIKNNAKKKSIPPKHAPKKVEPEKEITVPYRYKPEDMPLDEWQKRLRKQFGIIQNFEVENIGSESVFSDFNVYNPLSDNTYKVAIRSKSAGLNFCSCPDFKVNLLGTCKHIEYVLHILTQSPKNKMALENGNVQYYSSISLEYGAERKVYLRIGEHNHNKIKELAKDYFDGESFLKETAFARFEDFMEKVGALDPEFRCYPDAMDFIIDVRSKNNRAKYIENKYSKGIESPELENIISAKLFSYQKEGVLFAAKAGRCLIADEMGLGKTIQALAATELFAKEFNIEKVLIISPTSLKYQWKSEIEKFTNRSVTVIEGSLLKRAEHYKSDGFYKIASYNSIKNDLKAIENFAPDVVILDEAQRIKNWKTKTAQSVKRINSEFALVLTGTPLENRLDELHSLVEFIDRYKLGSLFRFLSHHQILDDNGKVVGYKDLNAISKTLESLLIRRKKSEVLKQLPERMDKNYFVSITQEQMDIHNDYYEMVVKLVAKWRKFKFLSEPDRKRLILGLSCMRMVCDSTYILDQKTRFDTKIDELMVLLKDIFENNDEKVVIFSQWERMTRLVAQELDKLNVKFEYLHGGVPSAKRKDLLTNFQNNPDSKVFLSTDAGGVGLNLQSANVIINLDIPWNPAILEQRIGRVYRIGQGKHVRVINFVASHTIEERILSLLNFKKSVFEGALDNGDDQVFVGEDRFKKIMAIVEEIAEPPIEQIAVENEQESEQETYGKTKQEADTLPIEFQEANAEECKNKPQEEDGSIKPTSQEPTSAPSLQDLFATGIDFFQKLSKTFSDANSTKEIVSSLVKKDSTTGKMSINIPIENEQIVEKALNAFETIMQLFNKK